MKINQENLRRIIVEEYIKEEGLEEADQEEIEKLLRQIRGNKYLPPEERDGRRYKTNDGETISMDMPHKQESPVENAVDSIHAMVADMNPEDVAQIFQIVFDRLPGVEIQDPEPEPDTLYKPGAEGRPTAGFRLEELKTLIRKVLEEEYSQDTGIDNEETVAKKDV